MRRIRLPLRRAALFVLLLLFMLAITLPLRLALGIVGFDERGLAAREAKGSVWAGELADARFGVVALGDAVTRLSFFPLFLGQAELNMDGPEGTPFRGELTGYRSGFAIEDAEAAVPLAALGLPSAGALILSDFSVRFEDGLCVAAAGAAAVGRCRCACRRSRPAGSCAHRRSGMRCGPAARPPSRPIRQCRLWS